jgi:hypothetical protein
MAHTFVILATQEVEIRNILVGGQPGQNVNETLISTNKKLVHACHPSYLRIMKIGGLMFSHHEHKLKMLFWGEKN